MDANSAKALQREILLGLWKVHILHHAAEGPMIGQWMIQELRRHGYEVSPGTIYPILHRMEHLGWLRSESHAGPRTRARRIYRLTDAGIKILEVLKRQIGELTGELHARRQN